MVRLFKLVAAQTAICLLWLRYVGRQDTAQIVLGLRGAVESMSPEHRALYEKVVEVGEREQGREPLASMDDILNPVLLAVTGEPPADISLIDKMIELLKVPFGGNLMSTKTIHALRKAMFSESEFEALTPILDQKQLYCSGCSHKFVNGEGAYFATRGDGPALNCFRCAPPVYSACSVCVEGIVAVSSNVRNSLQAKSTCEECRIKKAEEARARANEVAVAHAGGRLAAAAAAHDLAGNVLIDNDIFRGLVQNMQEDRRFVGADLEGFIRNADPENPFR